MPASSTKLPRIILCRLVVALSLLPAALSADVSPSGTVYESRQDRLVPLARVKVQAHSPSQRELLGAVLTDARGRYVFSNLPSERLVLTASRVWYYTQSAGDHEGDRIVLDCSQAQDCHSVDFVMGRAGVAAGRVVDEFGDPLQDVTVQPRLLDREGGDIRSWRPPTSTDDRGFFRIFDLPPGNYRIDTEIRHPNAAPRHSEPLELEINPGDEITGLQITLIREPSTSFSVSGKVQGIDLTREGAHFLGVRAARRGGAWGRRGMRSSIFHSLGVDGSFLFHDLTPGTYQFFYGRRGNSYGEGRESVPLDTVDVKADLSGLILRPVDPTGVRGSVHFESQPPRSRVFIWFASKDTEGQPLNAVAEPPDFRFENTNFVPGTYEVRMRSRSREDRFYLKGLRKGSAVDRSRLIHLTAGTIESVELVAATDFSRVSGRVKASPAARQEEVQVGAQFWVALKGPERVRTVQTDQHGRFSFDNVVPGEQQIGAWSDLSPQAARHDSFWEEAKEVVRRFIAEADSEIEIDLTAAP